MGGIAFGRWLLTQADRRDWIAGLAKLARADKSFPAEATPDALRAHLSNAQADAELFEVLDDAELAWRAELKRVA